MLLRFIFKQRNVNVIIKILLLVFQASCNHSESRSNVIET